MNNCKVIFAHPWIIDNSGRWTRGTLIAAKKEADGKVYFGSSICSLKDNFSRKEGRARATVRLISVGRMQSDFRNTHNNERTRLFILRALQYFKGSSYQDLVL